MCKYGFKKSADSVGSALFCYGDEENAQCACTNEHLTTANQSGIRKAYIISVEKYIVRKVYSI